MKLSFDPSAIKYTQRIQRGQAPLSPIRLTVITASGERREFTMHTFSPYFEPQPRHYFSTCGRFVVMKQRTTVEDETITVADQYHVYYNGNPVPDERFAIRIKTRETHARQSARYKQTRGRAV